MNIPTGNDERPPAIHGEPFHQETSDLDATRSTDDSTASDVDYAAGDPYADLPHPADEHQPQDEPQTFTFLDGASFILDRPARIPAIWGTGNDVLWTEGEALMIAGPQGVGKTTLAGQLMRARLGIGTDTVLGLPVARGERLLYLAMDRPSQIARAFGRLFTEGDRDAIASKLVIHRGPPPADLAKHPEILAAMCSDAGADTVMIDSVKDAAVGLSDDETGARYNRARQHALQAGVQVIDLHHTKKRATGRTAEDGVSIDDIYGSTWITSGCGSVIFLTGDPGDPIVGMRHIKQPANEVGPFRLNHDEANGMMTIYHSIDLLDLVAASGANGLTAKAAATALFDHESPSRGEIEKARRKLLELERSGHLVAHEGTAARGGKPVAAFFLAVGDRAA